MKEKLEVDIRVPNQTRYLCLIGKIGEDVARTLRRYRGDREELAYHLNLVLTEAMANAILHANADDPDKEIHVTISIHNEILCVKVYDQGQGFNIKNLPSPDFKTLDDHGRGVYIIRSLMDKVSYTKHKGGHVLKMVKSLL